MILNRSGIGAAAVVAGLEAHAPFFVHSFRNPSFRMGARKQKRILIVDDSSDLRRLYAIGLNQHGYEVKLAANGAEALERVATDPPDLIVLDVFMPLMNGIEFLDKLGAAATSTVPVIVVSGESGAPDILPHPLIRNWLCKPISIAELVSTIHSCFETGAESASKG